MRDVSTGFKYARVSDPEQLANDIKYVKQSQAAQVDNPRMRFWLLDKTRADIIDKTKENGELLEALLSMHHGIRSTVGRDEIVAQGKLGPDWRKAIVSSGEIGRHSITPEHHFIHVDPEILFSGGWDPQHIEQDKLYKTKTTFITAPQALTLIKRLNKERDEPLNIDDLYAKIAPEGTTLAPADDDREEIKIGTNTDNLKKLFG